MSSRMRSIAPHYLAILVSAHLVAAQPSGAEPRVGIYWGSCEGRSSSQWYEGAGTYSQVIIGQGFSEPNRGHSVRLYIWQPGIGVRRPVYDAWRFDDAGCQSGRLTAVSSGFGGACPEMGRTGRENNMEIELWQSPSSHQSDHLVVHLTTTYDLFAPDPETIYTLWEVHYDLSKTLVENSLADSCGGAEEWMVMSIGSGYVTDSQFTQNPLQSTCPGSYWNEDHPSCDRVQVEVGTWGRVKALYR